MSCGDDLKALLSRHVDGELSPPERAKVEEHLAGCPPCRELLAIFQKNESLLANALTTEAFGNAIIESVIGEIKGDTRPAEAKPVEEGVWEWVRSRPWVQFAAAGVLLAVLLFTTGGQIASLRSELKEARAQIQNLNRSQQDQVRAEGEQHDKYAALIHKLRTEDAIRGSSDKTVLWYVEPGQPHQLVVRANFDPKTYKSFDLYRKTEGDPYAAFVKVTDKNRLQTPEYTDTSVKPGLGYCYKFRAFRDGSDVDAYLDSFPIVMRVPKTPQLAPEKCINIRCADIAVRKKLAVFNLERLVNGQQVSEKFFVEIGQRVGDIREVAGVGRVDFRTDLVLESLDELMQSLTINVTRAVLDKDGKPMVDYLSKDTSVPKTVQVEEVLSTRSNLRALLRPQTPMPGNPRVDLWKGGWLQVRAQD